VKCPILLPHKKIGIFRKIFIEVPSIKFHAQPSSGSLAYTCGETDSQTDGKMHGRRDERTEGRTDGGKDGYDKNNRPYPFSQLCVR